MGGADRSRTQGLCIGDWLNSGALSREPHSLLSLPILKGRIMENCSLLSLFCDHSNEMIESQFLEADTLGSLMTINRMHRNKLAAMLKASRRKGEFIRMPRRLDGSRQRDRHCRIYRISNDRGLTWRIELTQYLSRENFILEEYMPMCDCGGPIETEHPAIGECCRACARRQADRTV